MALIADNAKNELDIQNILGTLDTPKSAQKISIECNIPIATVYRKLKELKKQNLVIVSGKIFDGRRIRLYKKSKIFIINNVNRELNIS